MQAQRALEPGRGRRAEAPTAIPWRGWKDILWRTYEEISADRLLLIAAGVVFYALLAMVPAITALVSMYGLFATASTHQRASEFPRRRDAGRAPTQLISEQIVRIAANSDGKLTFAFSDRPRHCGVERECRHEGDLRRAQRRLRRGREAQLHQAQPDLADASRSARSSCCCSRSAPSWCCRWCLRISGFAAEQQAGLLPLLRWPALFVLVMLGLAVLYRFGPSRRRAKWRWVSVGSVFAATAWIAVSLLFSWYLSNFADYNATYGSLGAVIGLMMWLWLSTTVVLVGAELNSEIEHQTARDSTVGAAKPLGARGAVMADTVGAAQS